MPVSKPGRSRVPIDSFMVAPQRVTAPDIRRMSVCDVQQFAQEKGRRKRRVLVAAKWTVSLALLALIVFSANIREVLESLATVEIKWILAAACLQPVGSLLTAVRWRMLLSSQGVRVRLWHLFRSCIAANFFKQFMPSTIGGDTIRAYDSWRAGASKSVAISTLVVDRLLGLFVLLGFVLVALTLLGRSMAEFQGRALPWLLILGGGLSLTVWLIFAPPQRVLHATDACAARLPGFFARLYERVTASVARFRGRHRLLALSLAISLALQLNVVVFYYLIGRAMGFEIPLLMFFVIVPLATFIMLLPVSINGIGVREGAFVVLFGAAGAGIASADAVAYAWLEYGIFLFHGILGGLLYASTRSPVAQPGGQLQPVQTKEPAIEDGKVNVEVFRSEPISSGR